MGRWSSFLFGKRQIFQTCGIEREIPSSLPAYMIGTDRRDTGAPRLGSSRAHACKSLSINVYTKDKSSTLLARELITAKWPTCYDHAAFFVERPGTFQLAYPPRLVLQGQEKKIDGGWSFGYSNGFHLYPANPGAGRERIPSIR